MNKCQRLAIISKGLEKSSSTVVRVKTEKLSAERESTSVVAVLKTLVDTQVNHRF